MKHFEELGKTLETIWAEANYDEDKFPSIAATALREADIPSKVTANDVLEWTMQQVTLPEQRDLPGRFGDPPITLYNSPRFHIDTYFWLEGTTSIHQHAFCGAFQVMHGSSIHSWYTFDLRDKLNFFTELGDINLKVCELLTIGDVQEIHGGKQYIHSLFHLDQPSVTIVVRTHRSPLDLPQFDYKKPFLAIDPFFEEPNTIKKMQCLNSMFRARMPKVDEYLMDWLKIADFQTTYRILGGVRGYYLNNQMEKEFNINTGMERYETVQNVVKERHGELAGVFPAVFAHQDKQSEILNRRQFITDPEQRFFLALLLNLEGRENILSLVQQRFSDENPLDKVLDWILDLSQTRFFGNSTQNALGIEGFNDIDLAVLEGMLKGQTEEEITRSFEREFQNSSGTDITKTVSEKKIAIEQSKILQPLISG